MFCLFFVVCCLLQKDLHSLYPDLIHQIVSLIYAFSNTNAGDFLKDLILHELMDQKLISDNVLLLGQARENRIQELKVESKRNIHIPGGSITRKFLAQQEQIRFIRRHSHLIQRLPENDACTPYLSDEIIDIINENDFWDALNNFGMKWRLLDQMMVVFQKADVCYSVNWVYFVMSIVNMCLYLLF